MVLRPAIFGDVKDIDRALSDAILDLQQKLVSGKQYTVKEKAAVIGIVGHMMAIRAEKDIKTKISKYREYCKLVNQDYARRFGEDDGYREVKAALSEN